MKRTRRIVAFACLPLTVATLAVAQPRDGAADDFAEGRELLELVRDHEFDFDDEAFYWYAAQVKRDENSARYAIDADADAPVVWRHLLERPGDFRGELILIEGRLMRHEQYALPNRPELGTLHQCELVEPGTRAICTVILTENPGDTPHRSMVRCKGFFIKVRDFVTDSGGTGTGPLIVGRRLELVAKPGASAREGPLSDNTSWIVGGTVVLALVWLFLRRGTSAKPISEELPRGAGAAAPDNVADFQWLDQVDEADSAPPQEP